MNVMKQSIWTKNFVLLLISNALLFMTFEMLIPTLPLFVEYIGGTPSQSGMIVGAFTFSALIIRLFSSSFAYFMKKKHLLMIGVFICAAAIGCLAFSDSLPAALLFRLMQGLGFGIASTYYATLAAEQLPISHLGEGLGYFGVGETIFISVGPMVGLLVLNQTGFSHLFLLEFAILFLSALLLLGFTPRAEPEMTRRKTEGKKTPVKLLEKRVLPQCFIILLVGITVSGVMSFLALYAKQQQLGSVMWFFFIAAISGIFVRVVSGKVFDRKGPMPILIASGFSLIIAMILIAYSGSQLLLNISSLFYGVAFGALFPAVQAWVISKVEPESRDAAVGSFLNFFDLGIGGGSMFLGIVIELTSYRAMYLFLIVFIVAYMLLSIWLERRRSKTGEKAVETAPQNHSGTSPQG